MAKRPAYPPVEPNEWVQPVMDNYGMMCCDCGLVHRLDFRVQNGRVQFRARRDERATGQVRRWNGITVRMGGE